MAEPEAEEPQANTSFSIWKFMALYFVMNQVLSLFSSSKTPKQKENSHSNVFQDGSLMVHSLIP
jgi:hypothetical protein